MKPHNPIEHVIIIVKENHTFDNYFGTFPGVNGPVLPHASDPPGPSAGSLPHEHRAWLESVTGVRAAVKQQYQESDIPAYFAYARQFTLCDNYFTEVASQSEPNHLMLIAADSPIIDNSSKTRTFQPQQPFDFPATLPDSLTAANLTWGSYGDPSFNYFNHIKSLQGKPQISSWTKFDTDVAAGTLPNVSWMYGPGNPERSEHPPYGKSAGQHTVRVGMQWTADRVSVLARSNLWATTAIFLTWDDWGGWYDHVTPLLKDTWQGGNPSTGPAYNGTQFSYGPRVGCLVLCPYSKRGISKAFHSHVSIVRFCEITFGLQPLNQRDAASDDMSDCFDFTQTPLPPPNWTAGPGGRPGPNPSPKPKPKPPGKHPKSKKVPKPSNPKRRKKAKRGR
jgi:phospholipase C